MVESKHERLDELALAHSHSNFARLRASDTVADALASLRAQHIDSPVSYFYVVDDGQLRGVVSTRRLLTAASDVAVAGIMEDAATTLPAEATLRDAATLLVEHRLLAVPIVGRLGRLLGVLDIAALGIDIAKEIDGRRVDEVFQLLGVHLGRGSSHGFRARFPALLWNVAGGLVAALIAGAHEHLLQTFTALALFMPVTLALSESIGMQSVALTLEGGLEAITPAPLRTTRGAPVTEARTALQLALGCAALVSVVAAAWQRDLRLAAAILVAITTAMTVAAVIGRVIPPLLRRMRQNPIVAAGPAVLAVADFVSLIVYFRVAAAFLPQP